MQEKVKKKIISLMYIDSLMNSRHCDGFDL